MKNSTLTEVDNPSKGKKSKKTTKSISKNNKKKGNSSSNLENSKKNIKIINLSKQIKDMQMEINGMSSVLKEIKKQISASEETLKNLNEGIISAIGSPDFIGCCVRKPLSTGTIYYFILSSTAKEVFTVVEREWSNSFSDYLRLAKENVYLSKGEADRVCLYRNTFISKYKK